MLAYFLYITISFLREFRTLSSPLISSTPNLLSPEFNSCLPISSLVFPCLHFSIFLISSNLKCSVLFCSVLFSFFYVLFCSVMFCSPFSVSCPGLLFLCHVLLCSVLFYSFPSLSFSLSLSLSPHLLLSPLIPSLFLSSAHLLTTVHLSMKISSTGRKTIPSQHSNMLRKNVIHRCQPFIFCLGSTTQFFPL